MAAGSFIGSNHFRKSYDGTAIESFALLFFIVMAGTRALAHDNYKHTTSNSNSEASSHEQQLPEKANAEQDREPAPLPNEEFPGTLQTVIDDIAHHYVLQIKPIFKQACFDCHSGLTQYPWYYSLPFISDLIDKDIREARSHLDFSNDFPFNSHDNIVADLEAIAKSMRESTMPPLNYRVAHWAKSLTTKQKQTVIRWSEESSASLLQAGYNITSK